MLSPRSARSVGRLLFPLILLSIGVEHVLGQCAVAPDSADFRSTTDGNWNIATTWEFYTGSVWVADTLFPSGASSGLTTVCSGDTVTLSLPGPVGGPLHNQGTITANATTTTLNFTGPSLINDGSIEVLSFRFNSPEATWGGTGTWTNEVITIDDNVELDGNVTIQTRLSITNNDTLKLTGDTLTVDGTSGERRLIGSSGGSIANAGEVRIVGDARLEGIGANWDAPFRVISGTLTTHSSDMHLRKDLTVEAGATLRLGTSSSHTLFVDAGLTNNGKITGHNSTVLLRFNGDTVTNNDTVDVVQFGFFGSNQFWAGNGVWVNESILVPGPETVTLSDNQRIETDLTVHVNGTLALDGDTLTIDGTNATRTVQLRNSATITNGGEIRSVGSVQLNPVTSTGSYDAFMHVTSGTTVALSTITMNKGVGVDPGATLQLGSVQNRSVIVNSIVTNNGRITGFGASSSFIFRGSTVTNNDTIDVNFLFDGPGNQTLTGNGAGVFDRILIHVDDTLHLMADQVVTTSVTFGDGLLNLVSGSIDLDSTGSLVSETSSTRAIGGNGTIIARSTLNAPSAENPGNLGASITSALNLGETIVTRGHAAQVAGGNGGIQRYYEVAPATDSGLNATLVLEYFEEELNGITEASLVPYRSEDDGSSWMLQDGTLDAGANTMTMTGLDSLSRWTLADLVGFLPVSLSNAKVFLEGPYSGGSMSTALATGALVPLSQPYDSTLFSGTTRAYDSTITVASLPPNAVDWVLLSLRRETGAASSVDTAVVFVLSDGSLVDTAGNGTIKFMQAPADSLYLVVRHRNHVGVMSSQKLDYTSGMVKTWDFTTAIGQAFSGGSPPMADLGSGVFGMFSGDYSIDEQVTATDFNAWLVDTKAVVTGYVQTDAGFDSQVTVTDFNLWLVNTKAVAASQVP